MDIYDPYGFHLTQFCISTTMSVCGWTNKLHMSMLKLIK